MINKPIQIHKFYNSAQRYIHFFNVEPNLELTIVQAGHQFPVLVEHLVPIVRDHYLLHFVRQGSGSLLLPHHTYNLGENDCFLIYPHEVANYTSHNDEGWEYYWIGFQGTKAEKYLSLAGFAPGKQAIHFENPAIYKLMNEIMMVSFEHQNDSDSLELHVGSLLRTFFFTLYQENLKQQTYPIQAVACDNAPLFSSFHHTDKYVGTIMMLIQSNYSQDIRVEDIASSLHLSRSYLTTLFKKETGRSIKQYLIYYRILSAMRLLQETDDTIASISFQVGFSDPLYFSKLFKTQVGQSPSEYRQSKR